jgi:hypothetical protein
MRYRYSGTAAVLAIAAALLWAEPALAASCVTSWQPVPSAPVHGSLADVSASSATNAWTVGTWGQKHTLAEHWNGSTWKQVPTPNPGRRSFLSAVVAISPTDAWAVGQFGNFGRGALLVHWDGAAWHRVALPANGRRASLEDITAVSPSDIWIVGATSLLLQTRTLHYNGSKWSVVPSVGTASGTLLLGVSAVSATDVWAVGPAVVERWNGHAWHLMARPAPTAHLNGVATVSATNVWAADGLRSAIDHWNGTTWSTSVKAMAQSFLSAIATSGANDVWAVGTNFGAKGLGPERLAVANWNGAHWVQFILSTSRPAQFLSVTNAPGTAIFWAVGDTLLKFGEETPRIEERC